MPVISWRDLGALDNLFSTEMDRMFGNMLQQKQQPQQQAPRPTRREGGPFPRVSLFENANGFELIAQVPGVAQNQLELIVHTDVLAIRGVRAFPEPQGARALRLERPRGEFERTIELPHAIATDKVVAVLKDGFLRVTLPKAPDAQPRRVEIQAL